MFHSCIVALLKFGILSIALLITAGCSQKPKTERLFNIVFSDQALESSFGSAESKFSDNLERLAELPETVDKVLAHTPHSGGGKERFFVLATSDSGSSQLLEYLTGTERWVTENAPKSGRNPILLSAGISTVFLIQQDEDLLRLESFNDITKKWATPISYSLSGELHSAIADDDGIDIYYTRSDGQPWLLRANFVAEARPLHWLDYSVIIVFACTLVLFSFLHSRHSNTAEGYFRGGKNVNWMAAGLSIVATRLSSTSFVSIPAKSFATNWQYALVPMTNIVGAFIMTRWFLRFFVRLDITSGYEYLEKRFSPLIRTLGSLNYLGYELARIGLLILVPAVALATVAKFDLSATILVIGCIATLYTVMGGIEGVIWADTFQIGIKVLGLIVAVISIFILLDGSPTSLLSDAWDSGKLRLVDWSFDLTRDTIWVFVLFWLTDGLKSYVANQTVIQRFISTRDESTAKRTVWTSAIVGALITWLLLLIGTVLYLYYAQNPDRFDLSMSKPDGVFPWFIVNELPKGFVGILIAALSAAAMSSLDGALNSTSTVLVTDFYRRFHPHPNDIQALRLGKILTLAVGLIATLLALLMASMANESLFDQTLKIIGLFGGGLGGMFLIGMLTTRTSAGAVLVGFICSAAMQFYVNRYTDLSFLLYMFTGMATCIAVSYLSSFILPERKPLNGLTVHTVN